LLTSISRKYRETALIKLIAVGLIIGILIALYAPALIPIVAVLGDVFVRALKGVAPILVFVLVMNAMAQRTVGSGAALRPIVRLYVIATFLASLVAVAYSFAFPSTLHLVVADATVAPPSGIVEVVHNLIMNVVDNPLHAIANANYIGILAWSVLAGIALQKASATTKNTVRDFAVVMTQIVLWVIRFAPFGIMGLVADAVGTSGVDALIGYLQLLAVLLGAFFSVALIMNPIIVWLHIRRNPFPLVFTTLRESGIYAFFTRSSAANIPVNLQLCKRLGLNPEVYSISIPLGATINMSGAAITIAILSLAAAHTLGVAVDLPTALLLVTVLSLTSALTRELAGRARTGLVGVTWVLLGLPAAVWADSAWVGLQANQRFVETEIIQPLKAAAPGSEVVVPNNLPAPLMSYGFAFLMPRYEEAMKIYHDLPRDLHVTNP